ncbi:MAG: DUF2628 domain-containing protein, partial [Pseudomonadota bacterium]
MKDENFNPLEDTESEAALAYAAERKDNIRTFVRTSPDYYIANFDKVGASARFTPTFNIMAGLFGPIWFGARGLWSWALSFLILEAIAFVQISRGLFGDLAADALARIAAEVNQSVENIGARRLYTVLERVFEELSFAAP